MNYKYIIAFLAKKPKPISSGWDVIKDFGDGKWSEEFCAIKNINNTDAAIDVIDIYISIPSREFSICNRHTYPDEQYKFYYNSVLNLMFYLTKQELATIGTKLEDVFKWLEDNQYNFPKCGDLNFPEGLI